MQSNKPLVLLLLSLLCVSSRGTTAQQASSPAPERDPQAVAFLQQSIAAMGAQFPSDSLATGSIVIVAGTARDEGTIRIQTRGLDQTVEEITAAAKSVKLVYSRGAAVEIEGGKTRKLSLERALTARSSMFPLPMLLAASNNRLWGLKYIGLEELDGCSCHHIEIWESFADRPALQAAANLSKRGIWLDSTSGLVRRVFYTIHERRGAGPVLPVEITFSDYRDIRGFAYPFKIETSLNGTPAQTITIQSVLFNAGLVEDDFAVAVKEGK